MDPNIIASLDPMVTGVMSSVIASTLTDIIKRTAQAQQTKKRRGQDLRKSFEANLPLTTLLQRASASTGRTQSPSDPATTLKIKAFLVSPDVEAMLRQIYASALLTDNEPGLRHKIQAEFAASLALHLGQEREATRAMADKLFAVLLQGCDHALKQAIDNNVLAAHEARSTARYHALRDDLQTIQKNLEFLTSRRSLDLQAILDFEGKYRQEVASRHGYIIPPHFDNARKVPIPQLYVTPRFYAMPKQAQGEPRFLTAEEVLSSTYRTVLLGNPGGGKSTFTQKVCYELGTRYPARLIAGRQLTPILVILREYGAEKKEHDYSIMQFVVGKSNSRYQLQPPEGAFEYLLLNGRAVLIFDGLDELLDTSYRREISDDVEAFCRLYPSVPVLVTSREVGYEQAPLDQKQFNVFRIAPFNDDEVREYASKWFGVDADPGVEQQMQTVRSFVSESRIVSDLRSNPLMLGLMCNLYKGEHYIPRNRPDVYSKCAEMLFERWDKRRGISVPLPFEELIRPAMMYLAHWIYTKDELRNGVTRHELIEETASYLCPRHYEDGFKAERAAADFIDFCRGRAWVFTDTGTTSDGEPLYQFTHSTFLEYFTAAYLVRRYETAHELGNVLRPRLSKREWDVVAQLAFQLKGRSSEDAGDRLLSDLLADDDPPSGGHQWNRTLFAGRCLEFMVPSARVRREVTKACLEQCLQGQPGQTPKGARGQRTTERGDWVREMLDALLRVGVENRPAVRETLNGVLIEQINAGSKRAAVRALEVAYQIRWTGPHLYDAEEHKAMRHMWAPLSDEIIDACSARVDTLAREDFTAFMLGRGRSRFGVSDLLAWYGTPGLFRSGTFELFPGSRFTAVAEVYVGSVSGSFGLPTMVDELAYLGGRGLSFALPWARLGREADVPSLRWEIEAIRPRTKSRCELAGDALFGLFLLLAGLCEYHMAEGGPIGLIAESSSPVWTWFKWVFVARWDETRIGAAHAELERSGLTPDQQAFIEQWIASKLSLVALEGAGGGARPRSNRGRA